MNVNLLIDSIVRQTTVLIAQLATTAGVRAPLAHTANQVFSDLVREFKAQGLGNKVIADMFGMALRTYHSRVRRYAESSTYGGRSPWEAVLAFIQERQTVVRAEVLRRFRNDNGASVKSVLKDLVASGMVFQSGQAESTTYRAATAEEFSLAERAMADEGIANMLWVAVNRFGPASEEELRRAVPVDAEQFQRALELLGSDGRVERSEGEGTAQYTTQSCVIPVGGSSGWEAAVFDHYQALVTAICTKLRRGSLQSTQGEALGGSTYGYDVWPGHPHYDDVLGFLSEMRSRAVALRETVEAHNATLTELDTRAVRVIAYVGQTILGDDDDEVSD